MDERPPTCQNIEANLILHVTTPLTDRECHCNICILNCFFSNCITINLSVCKFKLSFYLNTALLLPCKHWYFHKEMQIWLLLLQLLLL